MECCSKQFRVPSEATCGIYTVDIIIMALFLLFSVAKKHKITPDISVSCLFVVVCFVIVVVL